MVLQIVIAPDKRLKMVAKPVATVGEATRRLLDDMLATMYAAPGIGLAAPQVGVMERLIVLDLADTEEGEKPDPLRLINPEITWRSEETKVYNEGCLSLPDFYGDITRPASVVVDYLDAQGVKRTLNADGLLATCLQHEIDHLNGILFTDYLSPVKRNMIMRKLEKAKRLGEFD
jgi:peptide deformylase